MLLTISTTIEPATDLGYLLHKHPDRAQSFDFSAGTAHVFYPLASKERCTAALVVDVDPVRLVRGHAHTRRDKWTVDQYVNDRPYVASSLLSVAIREVYGTAVAGNCSARPQLVKTAIPLQIELSALPAPDESLIADLFEPLGYEVETHPIALDPEFPHWGDSRYFEVTLSGTVLLHEALSQLYILCPVLDGDKHYWVDEEEIDTLARHGEGWLFDHPRRHWIAKRYLIYQRDLLDCAVEGYPALAPPPREEEEERTPPLYVRRMDAVVEALLDSGARRVLDLGCGDGQLIRRLREHSQFVEIFGVDVNLRSVKRAARRLGLETWPDIEDERLKLATGSLLYRDRRLEGYDAAALVEVIEHLEPSKLATMEEVVFEHARPRVIVVTTPNREYNVEWETLPAGDVRHEDHRFEWTRREFREWAQSVAHRYGYTVTHRGIGESVDGIGTPTQMGIFTR